MEVQSNAANYKGVLKKFRPVNEAIPQDLNPPLERPELSRDPYKTPLSPHPLLFIETLKSNRRKNFNNKSWTIWMVIRRNKFIKKIILLRERAIEVCEEERGVLKHYYWKPYKIPVMTHEPLQKKPIPIPKSILPKFI
ncbi:hypothetical protein O181_022119 [Austropuccinia psidii MF-1]|uniref:Uncharacterized protein n=1 Tax=Austropuccinia psidii MF-1 TaxID=1389203 RepID=A0A9Q3CE67_9BASI|nr:hypothetical protein [Austropuccinia psidii MF-1]